MDSDLSRSLVTVDAKPAPVAVDIATTAVLVVDMQVCLL